MAKFSLQDMICVLLSWAIMMMMMHSGAQSEFFLQPRHLTWDQARNHCQVCFKELVTVTPDNSQILARKLTSDSWIGLRKHFNTTSTSSMLWSHWANGDPLSFQNWYPSFPVPEPPTLRMNCNGTCPAETTSLTHTRALMEKPLLFPNVSTSEDLCVAMLSFGAWVEKNCFELLPFICYDDDGFSGQVSVADVTTSGATLTWLPAPGGVRHYHVEVRGDINLTETPATLTLRLSGLTVATRYSVKVFTIKCGRSLNLQAVTFYTKPNKVQNIIVTMVTETSVFLSWNKPSGNVDLYQIEVHGVKSWNYTEGAEVGGLTPGISHTFTVRSGLRNVSVWSEESHVTAFTKPLKASGLTVSENTNSSMLLGWTPPDGDVPAFRVQAMNDNKDTLFEEVVQRNWIQTRQEVRVTGLPIGAKITLSVAALANGTVEGDKVTTVNYTAPAPISNLNLKMMHHSLTATWSPPAGRNFSYHVTLQLNGRDVDTAADVTAPVKRFDQLKAAAKYKVIVRCVNGCIQGPPVKLSKFTLPNPPKNAKVIFTSKTQLTFQWSPPDDTDNTVRLSYWVSLCSSFWGYNHSFLVDRETTQTFDNLTSGTKYEFEVRTKTDVEQSSPLIISHFTEADEIAISLSMLCSSSQFLCAHNTTEDKVLSQLRAQIKHLLGDHVFWNLEKQESENTII